MLSLATLIFLTALASAPTPQIAEHQVGGVQIRVPSYGSPSKPLSPQPAGVTIVPSPEPVSITIPKDRATSLLFSIDLTVGDQDTYRFPDNIDIVKGTASAIEVTPYNSYGPRSYQGDLEASCLQDVNRTTQSVEDDRITYNYNYRAVRVEGLTYPLERTMSYRAFDTVPGIGPGHETHDTTSPYANKNIVIMLEP